jgi:hypothetical protein
VVLVSPDTQSMFTEEHATTTAASATMADAA